MKKIDLYIIKKFLGTFFLALSLLVLIVVIFDISEKIDDFLSRNAPYKNIIFDYYLNFIPYFLNLFSPLFTFIAVIFFTSKMASNTEVIAILSSGISFKRFIMPYIATSLLLAMFSFVLSNFIIPPANAKRLDFEYKYLKNTMKYAERNVHMQIHPGVFVYVDNFDENTNTGFLFAIEKFKNNQLYYKLTADNINWDSTQKRWKIMNYFIRYIGNNTGNIEGVKETIKYGTLLDTTLNIQPSDFQNRIENVETMNFFEIRKFIKKEKLKGSDLISYYLIEKHKRIAFPFATVILTLIGVSLSSRKVRGGIGMHLGVGITISFAFILFMQISTTFAINSNLPAWVAVWIPNLIFGLFSIYLLRNAPK